MSPINSASENGSQSHSMQLLKRFVIAHLWFKCSVFFSENMFLYSATKAVFIKTVHD